jgi:spore maturation protein CgeB
VINKEEKPKWISKVVYIYTGDAIETSDSLINAMATDGYELKFDFPCSSGQRMLRFMLVE